MHSNSDKNWKSGRVLIGIAYCLILIFPLFFWLDENHYFSPLWHIHAQFHLLWTSMMMVMLGGVGLWLVAFRWRPSTARSLARWVPVVLCITYFFSHFLMTFLMGENSFPHLPKLFWQISLADLLIGGACFVLTIAAFEDMKDQLPKLFPQSG